MVTADLGMSLLSKLLSDFYRKSNAYFPDRIEEREFGVGDLVRKIAFRHMQFKSNDEFRKYMIANAPPYVSSFAFNTIFLSPVLSHSSVIFLSFFSASK